MFNKFFYSYKRNLRVCGKRIYIQCYSERIKSNHVTDGWLQKLKACLIKRQLLLQQQLL